MTQLNSLAKLSKTTICNLLIPLLLINNNSLLTPKNFSNFSWLFTKISLISECSNNSHQNLSFAEGQIKIINGQINLSDSLEQELLIAIEKAEAKLTDLEEKFALNLSKELSLGYFHQGQQRWRLKFTFGGLLLDTSSQLDLNTEQILQLKQIFAQTEWIEIQGKKYQTNKTMNQLGPILHEEEKLYTINNIEREIALHFNGGRWSEKEIYLFVSKVVL